MMMMMMMMMMLVMILIGMVLLIKMAKRHANTFTLLFQPIWTTKPSQELPQQLPLSLAMPFKFCLLKEQN